MSDAALEHKITCKKIKLMRPIFIVFYAAVKSAYMFEFLHLCLGHYQSDTQPPLPLVQMKLVSAS